jgi:hypothetical protein
MDTHNEGEDGQIAGVRSDRSATMGKSSCSRWPRAARATTSESSARAMATRGEGDDGKIAGTRNDSDIGQVDGVRGEWDKYNNLIAVASDDNAPVKLSGQELGGGR